MENLYEYFKTKINIYSPLNEIINSFCDTCEKVLAEKSFAFETGIYQFTCDEEYVFSLILKYKVNDSNVVLHIDLIYPPSFELEEFSTSIQTSNLDEYKSIIINSREYSILKNKSMYKINIYNQK